MALLSKKKVSFNELESKTITKINAFLAKRNDANAAVSEFTYELRELNDQIHAKNEEYADTYNSDLLREISVLKKKKADVIELAQIQREAFGKGDTKLVLTDADIADLTKTLAPYQKREMEAREKVYKQIAELEKSLEELEDAREEYLTDYWVPMNSLAIMATGEWYPLNHLKHEQPLRESQVKMYQITYHNAFPKGLI
ncbi:hypothetical protein [Paenibacillus sp. Soil787]|uniref:hypothetical protein n=1 Tax=Paenibacillus sp. Soil787 TaxID=1736411 RepID=UPI0006F250F8|nr:hypothetical protein [Paenibacillus sp. Soil787]KRF31951.1 hypothetical protein ASG93_06420 [Paenibacillus sp. Soil787]